MQLWTIGSKVSLPKLPACEDFLKVHGMKVDINIIDNNSAYGQKTTHGRSSQDQVLEVSRIKIIFESSQSGGADGQSPIYCVTFLSRQKHPSADTEIQ
jgi:hypothetical protein